MSQGNKQNTADGGIGFLGLLALLFIGLRLGNVIDWQWIWVLCPLWIPIAISMIAIAIILLGAIISGCCSYLSERRKNHEQ